MKNSLKEQSKTHLSDKATIFFAASSIIPIIIVLILGFLGVDRVLVKRDSHYLLKTLESLGNDTANEIEHLNEKMNIFVDNFFQNSEELTSEAVRGKVSKILKTQHYFITNQEDSFSSIELYDNFVKELYEIDFESSTPNISFILFNQQIFHIAYRKVEHNNKIYLFLALWKYKQNFENIFSNLNIQIEKIINEDQQYYSAKNLYLNEKYLSLVKRISTASKNYYLEINEDNLNLYQLIRNIFGQPIAIINIEMNRSFMQTIKQSLWLGGALLGIFSIILSIVFSRITAKRFIKPVEKLSEKMNEIANSPIKSDIVPIEDYQSLELISYSFNNILMSFKRYYNSVLRYEKIVKNLSEGVFWADVNGNVITSNKAFEKILELNQKSPEINFPDIFGMDNLQINNKKISVENKEIEYKNKILLLSFNKIMIDNKYNFVGMIQDITNLKKAEEAQYELKIKLAQSKKLADIGLLIDGISHNLNSPLNNLLGYSQLMKAKIKKNKDLDKIIENAERMATIIKTLLNRSNNEQVFAPHKVNLNELVKQELEYFQHNLFFKNMIDSEIFIDQNIPKITCVYSDISQCFANILNNAIDAVKDSEKKEIKIYIGQNEKYVYVSVSDSGIGISEEDIDKINEPFYSTKGSEKETRGLGLSVTKQLLNNYNGKLKIESDKNQGSVFTLFLPKDEDNNDK